MEIEQRVWLPASEDKLRQHGISRAEADDMVTRGEWVVMVHEAYPDLARVVGPTSAERLITMVVAPTNHPARWRPVTGWGSTRDERRYYWDEYR